VVCQFKSSPDLDRLDIQGIFVPLALDRSSPDLKLAKHSGVLFEGCQMRPITPSSVHLGGRLAENAPIIDSHFLEDDVDREATARVLASHGRYSPRVRWPTM
jgi:choline dehydrogenase